MKAQTPTSADSRGMARHPDCRRPVPPVHQMPLESGHWAAMAVPRTDEAQTPQSDLPPLGCSRRLRPSAFAAVAGAWPALAAMAGGQFSEPPAPGPRRLQLRRDLPVHARSDRAKEGTRNPGSGGAEPRCEAVLSPPAPERPRLSCFAELLPPVVGGAGLPPAGNVGCARTAI